MPASAYIWKGDLLAQARVVFETDARRGEDIAKRVGIDRRALYRLAKRHGWRRPVGARTHGAALMGFLYRAGPADDWQQVHIIGHMRDGRTILCEIGRVFPGVWIAEPWQLSVAK